MQSDPIPHPTMNPVWLAQSRLRRRKFDECISICDPILDKNPYDQVNMPLMSRVFLQTVDSGPPPPVQAVWYLKCRALTLKNWIDDTEIEEEVCQ